MVPGSYTEAAQWIYEEKVRLTNGETPSKTRTQWLRAPDATVLLQGLRRDAFGSAIDIRDHDGRGKLNLAIYSGQDGKNGKLSAQMAKRLNV